RRSCICAGSSLVPSARSSVPMVGTGSCAFHGVGIQVIPDRSRSTITTVPPFLIRANSIIRKSSRSAANTCNFVTDSCLIYTAPYGSVEIRRSEEHTSELQSRSDLVCRLLLEKKKKNIIFAVPPYHALSRTTAPLKQAPSLSSFHRPITQAVIPSAPSRCLSRLHHVTTLRAYS